MSEKLWVKYEDLESIRRLKNEGRELLGKDIFITEKRDGSNISLWVDEKGEVRISSHNLENAEESLQALMKSTAEYQKICKFLTGEETGYHHHFIAYGELVSGRGATRIERAKKITRWILFDIRDGDGRLISYNNIYQHAYHWKIPIVRALAIITPNTMEELQNEIQKWLKWCKKHSREGIVCKNYSDQIFFKEKIDLPKLEKIDSGETKVQLPEMDEHTQLRALQHAFDKVGEENWSNKAVAMPIVAKQFNVEAREHNFSTPNNMYKLYLDTPLEKLKGESHE